MHEKRYGSLSKFQPSPVRRPKPPAIEVEAEPLGADGSEPWRMKKIDAEALQAINSAMAKLGSELAREYGLVVTRLAVSFLEHCRDYGLQPTDLGRTFKAEGATYRVTGLRPRAKAPILCERLHPVPDEPVEYRFQPAPVRHWLHECEDQRAH